MFSQPTHRHSVTRSLFAGTRFAKGPVNSTPNPCMKTVSTLAGLCALLATSVSLTIAGAEASTPSAAAPAAVKPLAAQGAVVPSASRDLLIRGEYLVMRTGLCTDCHSPRNERGEHLVGMHLTGAPIPFEPIVPMPWVRAAPRLAGLPAGFNEEQMIHFLMTGERPDNRGQPLPPMPPYRFDRADAEAITAYLRTMPPDGTPEAKLAATK